MTTSQPTSGPWVELKGSKDWDVGLCSCFEECGTCLYAWFCLCPCLMWEIERSLGETTFFTCCCVPCTLRTTLRHKREIEGTTCGDCICTLFCGCCTVEQMYRELKSAGRLEACCCGPC